MKTYTITINDQQYEVKGCPFCGGGDIYSGEYNLEATFNIPHPSPRFFEINHACGGWAKSINMSAETAEELIKEWNTRA